MMGNGENDIIEISVNGEQERIPTGLTVSELIERFGEQDVHLVVELNSRCVFPQNYLKIIIKEGDSLEFVHPNFGG